jgi:chitinase
MCRFRFVVAVIVAVISGLAFAAPKQRAGPIIVGYLLPPDQALHSGQINPQGLTRINYAFANIQGGRMVLGAPRDAQNLAVLTGLKRENPLLTVLVSVGGWLGSNNFSDVALTAQSRAVFVQSVMDFLKLHDLDGLDVDWEYPGMAGSGHPFRSEDKQNFTYLLKGLRARFDKEAKMTGKRLYLTIAMGAFDDVIAHTEMAKVQRYVDTVNLMTYDYYEADADPTTGNHAPLFEDPADPKKASADASVRAYEKAGVPAEKILLGVPFYGRMWGEVPDQNHGLFQPGKSIPNSYAPYNVVVGTMLNQGFARFWDSASSVPYLYNPERHIFVSYEDPESLKTKCKYVLSHELGGVMFWEYFGDSQGRLLGTIDSELGIRAPQR